MCVALAYVIVHSACVNVMPTARTLPLCAVAGNITLVSNGESKIAIFKAALCYGFAIALRALFLVIRRRDFSRTIHCVIASVRKDAWQSTVSSIQRRLIASLTLAMTLAMCARFHAHLQLLCNTRNHGTCGIACGTKMHFVPKVPKNFHYLWITLYLWFLRS